MKRRCSNCGKEDEEYRMYKFNTGRIQWLCAECYKQGSKEAVYEYASRKKRIIKKLDNRGDKI